MQDDRFWWDDDNIDHIAEHGVETFEAEEVIANRPWIRRGGDGKYLAYGQTDSGRYLLVVFAPKADSRVRVGTARDMTSSERRGYRNR